METLYQRNAKIFKAFCDTKRQRILDILRGGERCACVLMDQMDMGQSAISYHMKILCEAGVVESRQEGKWIYYNLSRQGIQNASRILDELQEPLNEKNCVCK